MKTVTNTLTILLTVLLSACSPEVPEVPTVLETSEIIPVPAPKPREIHVQVRTGIIDWQPYDRWLANPPTLVLISQIDATTRNLLQERMRLSEVILSTTDEPAKKDYTAAVEQLKKYAPGPVRGETAAKVITTQQHVVDNYVRRWSSITPSNLGSVVAQLEMQYERDVEQFRGNVSHTKGGSQASANLSYVEKWRPVLISAKRLVEEMQAPAAISAREKALAEWTVFQEHDLPIVERVIREKTLDEVSVLADGSFEVEGPGEILIQIEVAGQKILYFKQGRHRFRFFNEQQTTLTKQEHIAQTE